MPISNNSELLATVSWLEPLGSDSLAVLARASRRVVLGRGQVLWQRGERTDAVAVIARGRIDVVRDVADGRRLLLRSLGPRESVGLSTLSGLAHSADLIAGGSSVVLIIPGRALREAIRRDPTVALRALAQLGSTIAQLSDELEELRFLQLDERLLRLIRRRARALRELRITHEELAQQVGATRENVSRALKRMERRGAIACRRGRIDVLNL